MAKKFGSNEIFIAIKEEDPINSYHSNTIVQIGDNEDEVEAATKSLNIVETFQVIVIVTPTRVKCPSSIAPCYYVEMPLNPTTPSTNPTFVVN